MCSCIYVHVGLHTESAVDICISYPYITGVYADEHVYVGPFRASRLDS